MEYLMTETGSMPVREGFVPFDVPNAGKPCQTWYKSYGKALDPNHTTTIVIHSGPGCPHQYIEPVAEYLAFHSSMSMLVYDQLGCGNSTLLPERNTPEDENFWTVELFVAELKNLIKNLDIQNYNIIGHGWGGLLAATFATENPPGLKKLILVSAPADMRIYVEGLDELIANLPSDVKPLFEESRFSPPDSEEYRDMHLYWIQEFICRTRDVPPPLMESLAEMMQDSTVFDIMHGPSEYDVTGSLRDYSIVDAIKNISACVYLINGQHDKTRYAATKPYFDQLTAVKWIELPFGSHCPWFEEDERRFYEWVTKFLTWTDGP